MGTLSLCFVVLLVSYAQLIGRMVADIPGETRTDKSQKMQALITFTGTSAFQPNANSKLNVQDSANRKVFFPAAGLSL